MVFFFVKRVGLSRVEIQIQEEKAATHFQSSIYSFTKHNLILNKVKHTMTHLMKIIILIYSHLIFLRLLQVKIK